MREYHINANGVLMIRATTPTHSFTFPQEVSVGSLSEIILTYSQCDRQILEKTKSDFTISGQTISVELTQQEVNKFKPGPVLIQIRVKNTSGKALASQIFKVHVKQVLNEEIL